MEPNDGVPGERIGLEKEDEFTTKIRDPKSQLMNRRKFIFLRGHVEYRDWCEFCVKAKGRERDCSKDDGKDKHLPEYSFDYRFQGMRWGTADGPS
eukprot:10210625-Karenia_brevis.AAC.1